MKEVIAMLKSAIAMLENAQDNPKTECTHAHIEDKSGESQYGPWKMKKCTDCGWVNWQKKTKDGGTFWKGWEPGKAR